MIYPIKLQDSARFRINLLLLSNSTVGLEEGVFWISGLFKKAHLPERFYRV